MDVNEAADHLAVIRRIMESATRLTVLPGKAALAGGALALAGCAVTYRILRSTDFGAMAALAPARRAELVALWVALALAATALDVLMTVRLARKRGRNPWPRLAQLAAHAMGPGILIAAVLTIALGMRGQWAIVPGVWMMLYGAAVWMTGILSVRAPGILGAVFVAFGIATVFWAAPIALIMVALTFGAGHIAYGVYLLRRFGE